MHTRNGLLGERDSPVALESQVVILVTTAKAASLFADIAFIDEKIVEVKEDEL